MPTLEEGGTRFTHAEIRRLKELVRELLGSWPDVTQDGLNLRAGNGINPGAALVLWGLSANVHHSTRAVFRLMPDDDWRFATAATPIVRSMWECALTSQWILLVRGAERFLLREEARQRTNLLRTLTDAQWRPSSGEPFDVNNEVREAMSLPENASTRNFRDLCLDLEQAGDSAYAIYRRLSSYSHASVALSDEYVTEHNEGVLKVALREEPRSDHDEDHLWWTIGACLVWAGSAVDWLDARKTRRTQLKAAARELQIPLRFALSGAAMKRQGDERRAEKATRRASPKA